MRSTIYYKVKKISENIVIHLFMLTVAVTCIFPLLWMVSSSLKTQETIFKDMSIIPKALHFENYYQAWIQGGFGRYFLNSLIYTVAVVIGIIIISSLAAYAFSRLKFPGKNIIFFIFIAAMMIGVQGSCVAR